MQDFITFDYFRSVFIFLIVVLVISSAISTFQKKGAKILNGFAIVTISLICAVVAGVLLYKMGYIVDELNLGGDPVSTYMVIGIGVLSVVNLFTYFLRDNRKIDI
ncbi:hypothetical protein [Gottfriedia solisilvae]|uniref:hypothetical protein n=1 Tax=Gottfriedia solisilvae TaxID=1516104 RepID=UPI003D2F48F5